MSDHFADKKRDPVTLKNSFVKALDLHEAGDFKNAAPIYRELLVLLPTTGLLLNAYGTLLHQQGENNDALVYLRKSLLLEPSKSLYYNRLGAVLRAEKNLEDAHTAYARAVLIENELYEANLNLAGLLLDLSKPKQALVPATKAAALQPSASVARLRLGTTLRLLGNYKEALIEVKAAKSLNILSNDVYLELSVLGIVDEDGKVALDAAKKGILLAPDRPPFYTNLLASVNLVREAVNRSIRRDGIDNGDETIGINAYFWGKCALASNSVSSILFYWHARNCEAANAISEGLINTKRAIILDPSDSSPYPTLSALFQTSGGREKAHFFAKISSFVFVDTGANAHILWETSFSSGKEDDAWSYWKNRFETRSAPKRLGLPQEKWILGDDVTGDLLVCSEQGIGDEILYLSCLSDLLDDYQSLIVECDERWHKLFKRSFPNIVIIPRQLKITEKDGPFYDYTEIVKQLDIQKYLLNGDLPRFYRSDFKTIPSSHGYLKPDENRNKAFKNYLQKQPGQNLIGVCWRSGFAPPRRSIYPKLEDLINNLPIRKDFRLINLQYGGGLNEIEKVKKGTGVTVENIPELDQTNDLDGVAALISSLDLVISTSTTVLHLACALGIPTISTYYPNFRSAEGTDPLFGNCYPMLRASEVFCSKLVSERTGRAVSAFLDKKEIKLI